MSRLVRRWRFRTAEGSLLLKQILHATCCHHTSLQSPMQTRHWLRSRSQVTIVLWQLRAVLSISGRYSAVTHTVLAAILNSGNRPPQICCCSGFCSLGSPSAVRCCCCYCCHCCAMCGSIMLVYDAAYLVIHNRSIGSSRFNGLMASMMNMRVTQTSLAASSAVGMFIVSAQVCST